MINPVSCRVGGTGVNLSNKTVRIFFILGGYGIGSIFGVSGFKIARIEEFLTPIQSFWTFVSNRVKQTSNLIFCLSAIQSIFIKSTFEVNMGIFILVQGFVEVRCFTFERGRVLVHCMVMVMVAVPGT